MTIIVHLTPANLRRAIWHGKMALKRVGTKQNYAGISRPDRYEVGWCGEYAVAQWLEGEGMRYSHHVQVDGNSQHTEFKVFAPDRVYKVDIKCGGVQRNGSLQDRCAFYLKRDTSFDIAIAARRHHEPHTVELMGWLFRYQVPLLPLQTFRSGDQARVVQYADMRSLDDVLSFFRYDHREWWAEYDRREAQLQKGNR